MKGLSLTKPAPASAQPTFHFTLPYPPQLNHLHTVSRGRKILSSKGRNYKDTAAKFARCAIGRRPPLSGDLHVTITVYRPRKSGDLDNFFKAPFDAVKGIAWGDDGQVRRITAILDDDKHDPRVEMIVAPMSIPDCPGCTDPHSEGTHCEKTRQHP